MYGFSCRFLKVGALCLEKTVFTWRTSQTEGLMTACRASVFCLLWRGQVEIKDGVRHVRNVDQEGGKAFIHLYSYIQRLTVKIIIIIMLLLL